MANPFPFVSGNTLLAAELNGIGEWTSYTPVLTASTTNPTLGSGSISLGAYARVQNLIIYSFQVVFGTSGVNAGSGDYRISLPVTANLGSAFYGAANGQTVFFDKSANSLYFANAWLGTTTYLSMLFQTTTNPSPVATLASNNPVVVSTEDAISGLIIYRAA